MITVINWTSQQYTIIKPMCNGWEWDIYNQNNELIEHDCSTDHLDDDCYETYGTITNRNIGFTFTDWYKWDNFTVITQE